MKLKELYDITPVERHPEIVVVGERLFFDGEEYALSSDGELYLVRSDRVRDERLAAVEAEIAGIKSRLEALEGAS